MPDPTTLGLGANLALFSLAAAVILACGVVLTRLADRLADVSGLGEAVTGTLFLGAVTSLAGSVTSVSGAAQGHPELALANAVGGIAAQTAFLVIADLVYRRANLEHAAASLPNIINGVVLILMLAMLLLAEMLPPVSLLAVHPATPALFVVYLIGQRLAARAHSDPMWDPAQTGETRADIPDEPVDVAGRAWALGAMVLGLGVIVGFAGFVIAETGLAIAERTGIREGLVGALLTAVATSTPELVTTIAAVRQGALTLAVGGILGGNTFDVLFVAFSDVAYRPGSIYHTMAPDQSFLVLLSIAMTAILLLGLLHRERYGPGNVGFESLALLFVYAGGVLALATVF